MALISLSNVSKSYGAAVAVKDVSFEIQEGENFILLGTSGCGKTTTLKMINGLVAPSGGTITIAGKNVANESPEILRRGIGYVLQHNNLFPHYTIGENIGVVPGLLKWTKAKTTERVGGLLEKLRLPANYASRYPDQLSGGEAQRINLARALAADPAILLMDEPFGALDPVTRAAIRKDFSQLEEFRKKTIVMVTHDVSEAFELGNRICLMDKGKVMQTGTPADLLFRPANDFVRNFLANAFMQLALTVTRLSDLWPYLDGQKASGTMPERMLPEESLWSALSFLTEKDQPCAASQHDGEEKQFTPASLLQAFTEYKKHADG